jgi:cyclic pyranopterin phosphate synthase
MSDSNEENATGGFSHIDASGKARMVDVGSKEVTERVATAGCEVHMQQATLDLIRPGGFDKGDVLGVARIAGVMAGKKTSELIPLCHPLPLNQITVDFGDLANGVGLSITSTARTSGKTGVEMEVLTAVSLAALTVYDMCKSVDRAIRITNIRLLSKSGGKSGDYLAEVTSDR